MALRKRKPTSPGRRFQTVSDFSDVTKTTPEKSLLKPKPKTGGRNNHGRKTCSASRRRSQAAVPGHRLQARQGRGSRLGRVHRVRPQPQLSASPCCTTTTARSATSSPPTGSRWVTCSRAGTAPRSGPATRFPCATSRSVPSSTTSSSGPAAAARWAVRPARPSSWWPRRATTPPSVSPAPRCAACPSTLARRSATVGNAEAELIKIGKAGRNRWKGKRPQTRGVAMNPVDHPHGGGEGKTSGGRHPVSPWGKPEGRTRQKNKDSDRLIIRRRRTRGSRR